MTLPINEGLRLAAWRLATSCRKRNQFYPYRKATAFLVLMSVAGSAGHLGELRHRIEWFRSIQATSASFKTLRTLLPLQITIMRLVSFLERKQSESQEAQDFVAILRVLSFALEHDESQELSGDQKNVLFQLVETMKGGNVVPLTSHPKFKQRKLSA